MQTKVCQRGGGDDCCELEVDAGASSKPEAISPARDQESRGLRGFCGSADAAGCTVTDCFAQRPTPRSPRWLILAAYLVA